MKYHVHKNPAPGVLSHVVEVSDGAEIPNPPWEVMEKEDFESWVALQVAAQVPHSVPRRAFRRALANRGITMEMLRAACASLSDAKVREKALADLDESVSFQRDNSLLASFANEFGFDTKEKLDALFMEAAKEDEL